MAAENLLSSNDAPDSTFGRARDALREYDAWTRPDASDAVASSLREVLNAMEAVRAAAWNEGHSDTDEHGPGNCQCPNPYNAGPTKGKR